MHERRITRALNKEELERHLVEGGRIDVTIEVPLDFLIHNDIEELNNFADESIIQGEGTLADINYKVVGVKEEEPSGYASGSIFLNVNSDIDFY